MPFTKPDVEVLSATLKEPEWVLQKRLEAWKWFESLELPHEKLELWRYTNLLQLKFKLDKFSPARPESATSITPDQEELVEREGERAGYVIQRDADIALSEITPAAHESGVILTDLNTAIRDHGELVQNYLSKQFSPDEGIFKALHLALFAGGTFLFVPKNVKVVLPFESQRWIDKSASAVFPHTLIVVEDGAEVVYFERFHSTELAEPSLSVGASEVSLGRGARLTLVTLQEYTEQVWHFHAARTSAGEDSVVKNLIVALGGRFSRSEVETSMKGDNIKTEMLGLYFAEHGQHFDFRTLQDHVAPKCTSDLLYKGALKDNSRAVYSGIIRVHEGAAKTDAYQANRNLVLSDHAKADSKPELEILNNDVRCTHGASVGQINKEEIFYLESRGIPAAEAQRLIVSGFFEEVVGRVEIDEVRNVLVEAIQRKLG